MKIAITGPPGSGKTTLLKRIVNRLGGFYGFYTEEVRDVKRIGFKVVPIPEGEEFRLAAIDKDKLIDPRYRVGRYYVDKAALDRLVEILEESLERERVAVDEVGKMELLHPRFRPLIRDLLEADNLAIITYGKNIDKLYRKYIEYRARVIELRKRGDAEKRLPIVLSRLR